MTVLLMGLPLENELQNGKMCAPICGSFMLLGDATRPTFEIGSKFAFGFSFVQQTKEQSNFQPAWVWRKGLCQ